MALNIAVTLCHVVSTEFESTDPWPQKSGKRCPGFLVAISSAPVATGDRKRSGKQAKSCLPSRVVLELDQRGAVFPVLGNVLLRDVKTFCSAPNVATLNIFGPMELTDA